MGSLSFTQKVSPVIMKVLLFAATLAIASAAFAPSCEECNQAAAGLLTRLTSAESIEEQKLFIIENLCPGAASLADCKAFVDSWGDIANCLYPAFIGASDTCERLGICKAKSVLGDLTCPDCVDIIEQIGDFLTQTDTMSQGEEILKGECFCGAERHEVPECPVLVEWFTRAALRTIEDFLWMNDLYLCSEIVGVWPC